VTLVILSPWPFGSVHPRTTQAIAVVSLVTALVAFSWDGGRGQVLLPSRAILWPLLGLWALAVFQIVPIPEALHRWIAPGSASIWYPDIPAAAAVLGPGPHPISVYPDATRRWLAFSTGVVALALAAAPILRERRYLLRGAVATIAGAVLVAIYGLVARLAFGDRLYGIWSVPTVAPFGPFVSKNHFAGYIEMATMLALGLAAGLADEARRGHEWLGWIESRRAKWVVLAWGAAIVLVLAVPASLSRGGVVSLTAGLLVFGVLRTLAVRAQRPTKRAAIGAAVAAILALTVVATVLPVEARSRVLSLAGITSDQSGSYRLGVWRDTARLVASSPWLGSGLGAYADALPRFKTAAGHLLVEHAESDWLEWAAETGLAGLLAVLLAIGLALLQSRATARPGASRLHDGLKAGAAAGLAALAVHSAFDFNLRIPANAALAALAAAVLLGALLSPSAARRSRSVLVLLLATLAVAVIASWTVTDTQASGLGRINDRRASLRRTVAGEQSRELLRHRPALAVAWLQLAWLQPVQAERSALASWASRLDPAQAEISRAARELSGR
jgi:O-antigen ligase